MANPRRIKRLEQLILEIAGETLQREINDPRMGLPTFTRVKLTSDLSHATLYWSCMEEEGKRRRTEQGLESALALLQRRVGQELRIRVTPRLSLKFDPSLEHAQRLEEIFHHLREERGETEEGGEDEEPEGPLADDETPTSD